MRFPVRLLPVCAGALASLCLALFAALPSRAQTVDSTMWLPNDAVCAMARDGGTLYLGGAFTYVGPPTGGLVVADEVTAQLDPAFPRANGTVNDVVSDGAGGWFVGGGFTSIGGVARAGLAHVNADFSVASWDPACNGQVLTLLKADARLYVGGYFTSIGGAARNYIAAFDLATGDTACWNPSASAGVSGLYLNGGTLYACGYFSSIGGQSRSYLAALDTSAATATTWNPAPNGMVYALAFSGSTVYAGGSFSSIGGASRAGLAALDAGTGLATAFNPGVTGYVIALALDGGPLYAGGRFTAIGGQSRANIAALDAVTGVPTTWNPGADYDVSAIATSGGLVYVAGSFKIAAGQVRNGIAQVDATTGVASGWNPGTNGAVFGVAVEGGRAFVWGGFASAGGVARSRLAAVDLATGQATAWNPGANGIVRALAVSGSRVYAGGSFTVAGGLTRNYLAALDATTGLATAWDPSLNAAVYAMAQSATSLYVGGQFSQVGATYRARVAAFALADGALASLSVGANGTVYALALAGTTLYAGGDFTYIGGQGRNRGAALNVDTGLATSWNPNFNLTVAALVTDGRAVYAGGIFTTVGGYSRPYLVSLNPFTGTTTNSRWIQYPNGSVQSLALSGATLFAGGAFTYIGSTARTALAAIDSLSGAVTSWNPGPNSTVQALTLGPGSLFAGGGFTQVGARPQPYLAGITLPAAQVVANATSVAEGASGTTSAQVPVGLTVASGGAITVDYATGDSTATVADGDYVATSGTLTFEPGETSKLVTVAVNGDLKYEPYEALLLRLSNATQATLATPEVTCTINNDDNSPTLAVGDVAHAEGNTGTTAFAFPLTLSNPSYQAVTVLYATADGTARVDDGDYAALSGTATIPVGASGVDVTVAVAGDSVLEVDETFTLGLSGAVNASLSDALGVGTIMSDEMGPVLTAVTDVPGDQGGWVWLALDRCILDDAAETTTPVLTYNVWRKLPPAATGALAGRPAPTPQAALDEPALAALRSWPVELRDGLVCLEASSAAAGPAALFPPGTWGIVASFAAMQEASYLVLAPTQADSPSVSEFVVSAHTTSPSVWCVGWWRAGSSVDNIAPGVPDAFAAAQVGGSVDLSWSASEAEDFQYFRIYRDATADFTPSETNLVQQTATLTWTDPAPGAGTRFYKLAAVDHAGNEGAPAVALVTVSLDAPVEPPRAFAFSVPRPNPFAGAVTFELAMPRAGAARVAVYDVQGRGVRVLCDGALDAGRHVFAWDGRDETGLRAAPGLYLCRATAPGFAAVRRVVKLP